MKEVVEEDTRSRNLIVYRVHDWVAEDLSQVVDGIFNKIGLHPPPKHLSACRIGPYKDNGGSSQPIKVTLECADYVKLALSKAHKLRQCSDEKYKKICLAPDRKKQKRITHQALVAKIRKLIVEQPAKLHRIRNSKVFSVDKE